MMFGVAKEILNVPCNVCFKICVVVNSLSKTRKRPSAIDSDELKTLVEANFYTIRELDVWKNSEYLNRIGKSKNLEKCVPHELKENQKKRRPEDCLSLFFTQQE